MAICNSVLQEQDQTEWNDNGPNGWTETTRKLHTAPCSGIGLAYGPKNLFGYVNIFAFLFHILPPTMNPNWNRNWAMSKSEKARWKSKVDAERGLGEKNLFSQFLCSYCNWLRHLFRSLIAKFVCQWTQHSVCGAVRCDASHAVYVLLWYENMLIFLQCWIQIICMKKLWEKNEG